MGHGHGYDRHHSIQYHHHHHHNNFHRKTILFLPMFCRLSIKDINLNNHHNHKDPIPAADEPSSPKVSCMGQVKRNNRVIGFPAAAAAAAVVTTTHHHKYSKLKKLFSSKTLLPPITTTSSAAGRSGSKSCRSNREVCVNNNLRRLKLKNDDGDNKYYCERDFVKLVNIGELDPPLPVVKRVAPPPGAGRDEVNLWKRRFNNGGALKSLQIEQIHHLPNNTCQSQPPTV